MHGFSATALAIANQGKDLDAFIERNNCFLKGEVNKTWKWVKGDYNKFIEKKDTSPDTSGRPADLIL